jgi:hypothetical protein
MTGARLPGRRETISGTDLDGKAIELSFGISRQLYRCPGCREAIAIGSEHIIVRITEPDSTPYHQHWHRDCARQITRELRNVRARRI